MNSYLIVSSLLVSIITVFFLIAVALKGLRNRRNFAFCIFALSVLVWIVGHLFWQLSETEDRAVFWVRVLIIGSAFIPYTYLHFVSEMTRNRISRVAVVGYVLAAVLSVLAFTPLIFTGVESRLGYPFWPVAGPAFAFYFGGFVLVVFYCFYLLVRKFRNASEKVRNELKYLIIGTAVGFFGGSTNFPLWLDLEVHPFGHGLSIFYIMGIGYSVLKYRLLDFNEMAVRFFGLVVVAILVGGLSALNLCGYLVYAYPRFYPNSFLFWWILLTVQAFFFLLLLPYVTEMLDNLIQTRFISSRFAYRKDLRELPDQIMGDECAEDFVETATRRIYEIVGLTYAATYVRSEFESGFTCKAREGAREPLAFFESERLKPMVKFLKGKRRAVLLGEEIDRSAEFGRTMETLFFEGSPIRPTDVFLPISTPDAMIGFLVLGTSNRSGVFADVDLLLLENLCFQLGLALRTREIERISSQVDKLVSLGTMAAGLAHELRNPLVSIRTLAALLARTPDVLKLNPEFRQTVLRDVKRISGIIEGVATFAQNGSRPVNWVALTDVIHEVECAMRAKLADQRIVFQVAAEQGVPPVMGNFEQLIQVFQNIVENGMHAIAEWEDRPEEGRISVKIGHRGGGRFDAQHWVEVEIKDNGPGLSAEYQKRIFDPFVTSRDTGHRRDATGTGLGLAIVSRIIESHRGMISVHSELGRGASFRVSIPCQEES